MKLVRPRRHRVLASAGKHGIRLLPGLITVGNLLFGFAALFFVVRAGQAASTSQDAGRFLPTYLSVAALMVLLAGVCDALDGRLARLAHRTSDFGGQLDSLADVVSFGAAPALAVVALMSRQLGQVWVIAPLSENLLGRVAWVAAGLFVACAALRLARFNVEHAAGPVIKGHRYFKGLPTPGAGIALIAMVILHEHMVYLDSRAASSGLVLALPAITTVLALLMVSPVRYPHVLNVYLRRRRSFAQLIFWVVAIAALLSYPELTIALSAGLYVLSGPVVGLLRWGGWMSRPANEQEPPAEVSEEQIPA